MSDVRPFRFEIPDGTLNELKRRLAETRWPDRETPKDWSQGVPLAYTQEVCEYWRTRYDWRRCEARLNALPQFLTTIDGLDIQFIHLRSKHDRALPMVVTHGWPGSVIEFLKVLGPLTDPTAHGGDAADAFHVVCPTLPGFGFSGKPTAPGWGVERIGRAWASSWRVSATTATSRRAVTGARRSRTRWGCAETEHCIAMHSNMPLLSPSEAVTKDLTEQEKSAFAGFQHYWDWDSGYSKEQSTRPQTVGYGLVDSPAAQCAWILEKFWSWTDCNGHPENALTRDEMLDNIMLYWLPGAAASSARLYWESFRLLLEPKPPIHMPVGCQHLPARDLPCLEALVRGALHEAHPLQRARQGRPFRGVRAAGDLRERSAHLFSEGSVRAG